MLNLGELKPDYEGTIGPCNWSFKLFIFQQGGYLDEGYFKGLIEHQIEDGTTQPVEGILSEDSLLIVEKEFYGDGQESIVYEFNLKMKKLDSGSHITGKQTKLAKLTKGKFHNNFTRKAKIWKS